MPDILHRFTVEAPAARVFAMFADPRLLSEWWTLAADGTPETGEIYRFDFGPDHQWQGLLAACDDGRWIEWELLAADSDWTGTRVGARFTDRGRATTVDFYHSGWRHANEHFRTSSCCWANYLRVLRRYLEHGERVPYDRRDAV
ncbi:MAG: SRPBCC domain-containing protein [Vicinamibacterales bacterium]